MLSDVDGEPLTFCTRCCMCKKHKIDDKGRQSGVPDAAMSTMVNDPSQGDENLCFSLVQISFFSTRSLISISLGTTLLGQVHALYAYQVQLFSIHKIK